MLQRLWRCGGAAAVAMGIAVLLGAMPCGGCSSPGENLGVDTGKDSSEDSAFGDITWDLGPEDNRGGDKDEAALDGLDADPDGVDLWTDLRDGGDTEPRDGGDLLDDLAPDLLDLEADSDVPDPDAMDAEVDQLEPPVETCNGVDDDNDGETDEGLLLTFQADADGDGFGDPYAQVQACSFGPGLAVDKSDCDDADANSYPGAVEVCDDADNDCDGIVDEDQGVTTCGLGPCNHLEVNCYNGFPKQCDPMKGAQNEVCDGTDNDCDGTVDDGVLVSFFYDEDGDGFGQASKQVWACLKPAGASTDGTDCDDTHASVWPGNLEVCDGLDNDCNGAVDDGIPALSCGLGACLHQEPACGPGGVTLTCDPMLGWSSEICDGVDNDCDGEVDNGVLTRFYRDDDGDGFGLTDDWLEECLLPEGYALLDGDCDDTRPESHPEGEEVCSGFDEDCDGEVDEEIADLACGSGVCLHSVVACVDGVPATCDPMEGAGLEVCDGLDNDCDGEVDQGFGETTCGVGSCEHTVPNCLEGKPSFCDPMEGWAAESCDLQDNDCDGEADEELGSTTCGLGVCEHTVTNCVAGVPQQCDPLLGSAAEECDGSDNDCDGNVDEDLADLVCGLGLCLHAVPACVGGANQVCDPLEGAAPEQCDGWDNDCDGEADNGLPSVVCGLGNCEHEVPSCVDGVPQLCDEMQGAVPETCDGQDNDCDGEIDNGVLISWYRDEDEDSFGDPVQVVLACVMPAGYVANSLDCNDKIAAIKPGGIEVCDGRDQDCDGQVDEGTLKTYYLDADLDGYGAAASPVYACALPAGASALPTDCDDSDKAIHPGGVEICDGKDQDCDGAIDDGVLSTFYVDADGDGFGTTVQTKLACTAPPGFVFNKTDCNDNSAAAYPGATEVCDTIDNDCDGSIDEGVKTTYYRDADGDGYGVGSSSQQACSLPPGYSLANGDCDDTLFSVRPGATEICDSIDNDCDGGVDEGVKILYYRDADGDGFGTFSPTTQACSLPTGYATNSDDCNDNSAASHPGATEVCDGTDNDCDGSVDEGVKNDYYRDVDGDGFGNSTIKTKACSMPTGYVVDSTDCNDNRGDVYPDAPELCDYIDNDCDGSTDEGVVVTYYRDSDSDGFGNPNNTTQGCSPTTGYIVTGGDCDDSKAAINPNATEVCDGADNDCDSLVDEGVLLTYYQDGDFDGYGVTDVPLHGCTVPAGYALNSGDCDDTLGAVHPGADEACDTLDNDCDLVVDEDWAVAIVAISCGAVTIQNTGSYELNSFGLLVDGNVVAFSGPSVLQPGQSADLIPAASLNGTHTVSVMSVCSQDSEASTLVCP